MRMLAQVPVVGSTVSWANLKNGREVTSREESGVVLG
jgi:hypothetical protein